ncbi:hypothetical protein EIP91_011644 [Steccherinum ochraceum]|uniref:Cytochrome P450 n=1 Tax=Steccherinum ochraceum TaxID=92696 RepID=A0A4R0RM03_9APHY|nr:hypothetical protein EIP91_011644 [Steccherinum ochraceum]
MTGKITGQFELMATDMSPKNAALLTVGVALLTHFIFNRYEPILFAIISFLLVLVPLCLSLPFQNSYGVSSSIGLSFTIYHATLLASIAVYRLSPFHPLARYPGPVLNKLSSWWLLRIGLSGKRHVFIQDTHRRYNSDVVRIGPNELSIVDPDAVIPVLGPNGLPKGPAWDGHVRHSPIRPVISWRNVLTHSKSRRGWMRAFSTTAVKEYEPILIDRVSQLVELIKSHEGRTANLSQLFRLFTYDFMEDMAFGGGTEVMRDGDTHGMVAFLRQAVEAMAIAEAVPWLSYYIPSTFHRFYMTSLLRAQERVQKGSANKDAFYYLNNEGGMAQEPHPVLVAVEGPLIIIAGSDTTSSTLSNILWCIIAHPEVYRKLQAEVDRFYPPGESALNSTYHADMKYLDAVVNEVLRLYPTMPSNGQRASQDQGIHANSIYIPPHTSVRIHIWTMWRDPRNFYPLTESFWPERWLIAQDPSLFDGKFVHNSESFNPFSYGPASCAGRNLATKELRMVVCHLLQQVDLTFAEGYDPTEWEEKLRDPFTLQTGPLPVNVTPRIKT